MDIAAFFISVLALLFTLGSFWWLWVRRGPVVSFPPAAFAAVYANGSFRVRLPVVFSNRGAAMRVIADVRLRLSGPHGESVLPWGSTHATLNPSSEGMEDFPTPQTLPGRTAERLHLEFLGDLQETLPEPRDYAFAIETRLDSSEAWNLAGEGVLRFAHMVHPGNFITYSNSEDPCTDDEPDRAGAALLRLAEQQGLHLPWR